MDEIIIGMPLSKPPHVADRLASKDNLLAVWRWAGYVMDEGGTEYDFGLYSPAFGWRGYHWNNAKYGVPLQMLPAPQDTMWAHAFPNRLLHLQIRQNGELAITDTGLEAHELFHANAMGSLVKTSESTIGHLRFGKNDGRLSRNDLYDGIDPSWAHFLSDGAIAIYDSGRLIVISPKGDKVYEKRVSRCDNYPPFIICYDDGDLYYTDDPRAGWRRTDVLNVIRNRTGEDAEVQFFTALGNEYYIASGDSQGNIHLHCLSPQLTERVEHIWGITPEWRFNLTQHDRFICIISPDPFSDYGDTKLPKNNGFLIWDPASNTFHPDVPRAVNIPKISAGRIPTVDIPDIWGQDIRQR